jgi:hypothetical protein
MHRPVLLTALALLSLTFSAGRASAWNKAGPFLARRRLARAT